MIMALGSLSDGHGGGGPTRRAPTISRELSLGLDDLDCIDESQPLTDTEPPKIVDPKVVEHEQIFEELCDELDRTEHDTTTEKKRRRARRMSLQTKGDDPLPKPVLTRNTTAPAPQASTTNPIVKHEPKPRRRHSSFESRERSKHRIEHKKMKEYIKKLEDVRMLTRSTFVDTMLKFNLSVDMSMASMGNLQYDSAAMHLSCPILSYMGDEEEDSVEMMLVNKRLSALEPVEEEWEMGLNGDDGLPSPPKEENVQVMETGERTYTLELPPEMEDEKRSKSRLRKSRKTSYKDLEKRLELDSPHDIIRQMSTGGPRPQATEDRLIERPLTSGRMSSFSDESCSSASLRSSGARMQAAFRNSGRESSLEDNGDF